MIRFKLSPSVLGNTRFMLSPLAEATLSLHLLGLPHPAHVHHPWIRVTRSRLEGVDTELLLDLVPKSRWIASFLLPYADEPQTTITDQLQALAQLDPGELEREMWQVWEGRNVPRRVQLLIDSGAHGPPLLAEALWDYWDAALAPHWSRMCAVLEDDVAHRMSRTIDEGLFSLLADLHPEAEIDGDTLLIHKAHYVDQVYTGTRMTLVPSIFAWPKLVIGDGLAGVLGLTYAARGVGRVWEGLDLEAPADGNNLGPLLGRTRAAILEEAGIPISTTQIARSLGQSPSTVSQHLTLLRDAGLLTCWRSGRSVLYRQTPLAQSMLAVQTATTAATTGTTGTGRRIT